ncbi:MAG: hypothetical protein PGN24_04240 [Microbacterium arborescens]
MQRIGATSAATPFGVIVMQVIVWVGMSAIWIPWAIGESDPIRVVLAVISPLLACYWLISLAFGLHRRRVTRPDGRR